MTEKRRVRYYTWIDGTLSSTSFLVMLESGKTVEAFVHAVQEKQARPERR
jgi:hypothetical protein